MTLFFICLIIILFFLIGYSLIQLGKFLPNTPALEKLSISYGLGVGLVFLQLFIYSLVHLQWTRLSLILPWLILIIFAVIKKKFTFPKTTSLGLQSGLVSKLLLFGLALTIGFVIFEALIRPMSAWDGWAKWYLGANAFFYAKSIDVSFIKYANYSDPPLINLSLAFIFTLLGKINDTSSLLFFTFFYLCLLGTFYSVIRKITSKNSALLFTFLFAALENFIRQAGRFDVGNADLPLSYFFFICVVLFLQLKEKYSLRLLALLNIFLIFASLTKNEGYTFLILMQSLIFYYLFKTKQVKRILISVISIGVFILWLLFNKAMHLPQYTLMSWQIHLERARIVIIYIMREFINLQRWNFLWISFIISLFLASYTKTIKLLIVVIGLQFFSYFLVFLTTTDNIENRLGGSLDRLLLQLAPMVLYCIAIVFAQRIKNDKKTKV